MNHSAKNNQIIIDHILESDDSKTILKQVGVIRKQHLFCTSAQNSKIIYVILKSVRDLKSALVVPHFSSAVD